VVRQDGGGWKIEVADNDGCSRLLCGSSAAITGLSHRRKATALRYGAVLLFAYTNANYSIIFRQRVLVGQ